MQITAFAFCNVRRGAAEWIRSPATLLDTPCSWAGPPVTFRTVLTLRGTDSKRCWKHFSEILVQCPHQCLKETLDQNHWVLLLAVSCYGLLLLKVPRVVCSEKAFWYLGCNEWFLVLLLPFYHLKPVYPFSSDLPSTQPPPAGYFLFFGPFSVNSRDGCECSKSNKSPFYPHSDTRFVIVPMSRCPNALWLTD